MLFLTSNLQTGWGVQKHGKEDISLKSLNIFKHQYFTSFLSSIKKQIQQHIPCLDALGHSKLTTKLTKDNQVPYKPYKLSHTDAYQGSLNNSKVMITLTNDSEVFDERIVLWNARPCLAPINTRIFLLRITDD